MAADYYGAPSYFDQYGTVQKDTSFSITGFLLSYYTKGMLGSQPAEEAGKTNRDRMNSNQGALMGAAASYYGFDTGGMTGSSASGGSTMGGIMGSTGGSKGGASSSAGGMMGSMGGIMGGSSGSSMRGMGTSQELTDVGFLTGVQEGVTGLWKGMTGWLDQLFSQGTWIVLGILLVVFALWMIGRESGKSILVETMRQ